MPELIEQMYCSQQIVIPPKFPYILKRYCKAAIKTQPYDLLRWSFEYFRALSLRRPPPVKLRLEYPVYSTEGGLTRGCLKVLANQLIGMSEIPLPVLRTAWQGFCLDASELRRILCLCDVYLRSETVPFLHFVSVAGGLLTKNLTHTMILLCETLTKQPDGGSAAIPIEDFLTMYKFLAKVDASKDVRFLNGYREGTGPVVEALEEEQETIPTAVSRSDESFDDFWDLAEDDELQKISVINDHIARTPRLSVKLNRPVLGKIERSPSVERAKQMERDQYMRERTSKPQPSEEIEHKLKQMSAAKLAAATKDKSKEDVVPKKKEDKEAFADSVNVIVFDPDNNEIPAEIYGEPVETESIDEGPETYDNYNHIEVKISHHDDDDEKTMTESIRIRKFVEDLYNDREMRREDLLDTFIEIEQIVDRFQSANYDLGMVAGRQMSTTSGEFIVQTIERQIMDYIDEQIAILPDPDLKKKKAKPEEVAMIRDFLENFLDENMAIIVPEVEEIEEEEEPVPEVTVVYAVPGIGPPVDDEIMIDFTEYALEVCKNQSDVFMPRNIRHFLCPPLEKYAEHKYDESENIIKKEGGKNEVPTEP